MSSGDRPTDCSSSPTRAFKAVLSVRMPCSRSGSPMMSCTIQRGFRLAYGSWKIIWMRRRSWRPSGVLKAAWASCPSNWKPPRVGPYRPTRRRATVLLPQPDSPTRASVLPRSIVKLTPSTACSRTRGLRSNTRLSQGGDTSKLRARSWATTSGAGVCMAVFMGPSPGPLWRVASRLPGWHLRA